MYRAVWVSIGLALGGCGGCEDPATADPDAAQADARPDTPASTCLALPAMGQFMRRAGNPRLLPGQPFSDGKISVGLADPDVSWNAGAARYELYYSAPHAALVTEVPEPVIRRATSPDRVTWTVDDVPVLRAPADPGAWDAARVEAPTVVENPAAPPDRRYLMLYAGAARAFPFPGYAFAEHRIGAAFSADGKSFTRVPAAQSPHGEDGLVLTGSQVYGAAVGAVVSDPEVVLIGGVYHLWFSSFACDGAGCANVTNRGVAYATSLDGITWTVIEAPVRSLLRAAIDRTSGGRTPSVIYDEPHCRYELWQHGDLAADVEAQPVALANTAGVYRAESTDGRTWSIRYDRPRDLAWSAAADGEGLGMAAGLDVAQNATGRLMLYVGYDDEDVPAGFTLPDRATAAPRPGVTALNVATRDLP
jgi:hypothetical protein